MPVEILARRVSALEDRLLGWNKWSKEGVWQKAHDELVALLRKSVGRDGAPTACIIDSQSVKVSQKGALVKPDTTPERKSKDGNATL
jgi:hypothetical protein